VKLLLEIAEFEIQSCVHGHGIEEPVYTCMRCVINLRYLKRLR